MKQGILYAVLTVVILLTLLFIIGERSFTPATNETLSRILPTTQTAAVADFNSSLIAHYTFDGNTNDSAGSNTGTANGGPTYTTGKIGQGLSFDGVDDYVSTGLTGNFGQQVTISAWVMFGRTAGADRDGIIGSNYWADNEFILEQHSVNNLLFLTLGNNKYVQWSPSLSQNAWHHVAVVIDTTQSADDQKAKLYFDGVLQPQAAFNGITNESVVATSPVFVGTRPARSSYFNGSLDDVRMYRRAFSAADVQELYAYTGVPAEPAVDTSPPSSPVSITTAQVQQVQSETPPNPPVQTTPEPPANPVSTTEWYVSPSGSAQGDGSISNPWDLQTALCSGRTYTMRGNGWPNCSTNGTVKVLPGHTVWLRGGTYGNGGATLFQSRLQGTSARPIVVKQYPGERAIINGGINEALLSEPVDNYARYVWYWGFEITNTSTRRVVPLNNIDTYTVGGRPPGLELHGQGSKAINLIIHDVGHPCIGFWKGVGDGGEINGVIMWGCGFDDTGTVYTLAGSGIYAQNTVGTRYIKDVISFRQFTTGFKIYGNGTDGFRVEGNILFNNHQLNLEVIPNGGDTTERLVVSNNYTYRPRQDGRTGVEIGRRAVLPGPEYLYDEGTDVAVTNNYFVVGDFDPWPDPDGEYPGPPIWLDDFSRVTVTGNTFVGGMSAQWAKLPGTTGNWNNNTYYSTRAANDADKYFLYLAPPRSTSLPSHHYFNEWKNICNCDTNSTFANNLPTQNVVIVRPNQYEQGRAHIVVYNWQRLPTVSVDLSNSGLRIGQSFEIRDAQNYFGPIAYAGTYTGGAVQIPTTLTGVSSYVGDLNPFTSYQLTHTPSEFNAFVVIPTPSVQSSGPIAIPSTPQTFAAGDFNRDGLVNTLDFSLMVSAWNHSSTAYDLNNDGIVNTLDYVVMVKNWSR